MARLAPGIYEVVFTGDVRAGVYEATIGRPGIFTEPTGQILAAREAVSENGAWWRNPFP